MNIEQLREEKLKEAKIILDALGLPSGQKNDRSAWVFLALANIKPEDDWKNAKAPLLPTVNIMAFIRNEYGMDYKPNSRETIRRQTLHQFEQARIVDRNRDFSERPTNSKDNNYSLNKPILDILHQYPDGVWEVIVEEFIGSVGELKEKYKKKREMVMIPITLPDGEEIKLTPGKHNQLHADIIHKFCPRFVGENGIVLYIGDTGSSRNEGGKMMIVNEKEVRI